MAIRSNPGLESASIGSNDLRTSFLLFSLKLLSRESRWLSLLLERGDAEWKIWSVTGLGLNPNLPKISHSV